MHKGNQNFHQRFQKLKENYFVNSIIGIVKNKKILSF